MNPFSNSDENRRRDSESYVMEVEENGTTDMDCDSEMIVRDHDNRDEQPVTRDFRVPKNTDRLYCSASVSDVLETNSDVEEFKKRMPSLSKMELKSAQAFLDRGIHNEFNWPVNDESKENAQKRKILNSKALKVAQNKAFRNTENKELRKKRREADAEHHRRYRNPEDVELNRSRHEAHAEQQRIYRNPEDTELNRSRHECDAERDRERNLPGRQARSEETPEQALERMQNNFEERMNRAKANKKACNADAVLNATKL